MNKTILFFTLLFVSTQIFWAQKNPRVDKQTFFTKMEGREAAMKSFRKAEKNYKKGVGTFDEALKYYKKVYKYNPNSDELNYKLGICYLFSSDKAASLKYFLSSNPDVAKDYYLVLGRAYQYNSKFDLAKETYNKYLSGLRWLKFHEQSPKIQQLVEECDFSKEIKKDSLDVFIVNLGPVINSYYDDYNAFLPPLDSNIFFTTKRPEKEPKKQGSRFKYKEQVYQANNCLYKPCEWAVKIKALNAGFNTSMAGVDKNEHRIFFYEGKWHSGQLLMTRYSSKKNKWTQIKKVKGKINHIAYNETSISVGPDNTAYFISDRMGSEGGKDIWVAPHKRKDKWGKPYNIGDHINTPFDEESVYISDDGNTLYFSSKGHPGMGGFDVYKSTRGINNEWSAPVNMGHPINSPADELFYHPTRDTMVALYSTIRGDSYGGLDIYKIQTDPRKPFVIQGKVTDIESGEILAATINVIENETNSQLGSVMVDSIIGDYSYSFEDIGDFGLQVNMEGYKTISDTIECTGVKRDTIELSYQLELIRHPFTLSGIISDIESREPLKASVVFKDTVTGTFYGRQFTDEFGHYSITFGDKYDMVIQVEADNYYPEERPLMATRESSSEITRDIALQSSKVYYNLTGNILDEKTSEAIYGILSFYRPGDEEPFKIVDTDTLTGKYNLQVEEQGPFLVEVAANGYFFVNEVVEFNDGQKLIARNFMLKKMSLGAKIVVENILFNTGKSSLKPESFKELDKLAILLIRNPDVRIEVSGHTDNVGSASVNKKISKARALTVKNYLASRGVEAERMEYEGYGFDQPIASNDTKEGKAQNRRVEIKILE